MAVIYSEDFSGYTPYSASSNAGWPGTSAQLYPSPTAKMGTSGGTDGDASKTFATGGTLSYDWGANEGTAWVKVYVAGVLQKTHNGNATGSDSVTVADGEAVKFEFNTDFGEAYVDNLSLESGSDPLDPENIRTSHRVEEADVTHGWVLTVDDVRTETRVNEPSVTARKQLTVDDIRTETRVSEPDVTVSPLLAVDHVRTSHRVEEVALKVRHPILIDDIRSSHRVAPQGELFVAAIAPEHARTMHRVKKASVSISSWQPKGRPRPRLFIGGGLF